VAWGSSATDGEGQHREQGELGKLRRVRRHGVQGCQIWDVTNNLASLFRYGEPAFSPESHSESLGPRPRNTR
jgi:hypothetical protein